MERWIGRVAIVTGASSGIGAAIAKLLAEQGMKVVGVARVADCVHIERASHELKDQDVKGELHAISGDVTSDADVTHVITWTRDTLGGAEVLVNCAGVNPPGLLSEISTSDMKKILDTNILGLSMFTRDVIKDMRSRGVNDGHIFHICSAVGQRIVEYPGIYMYIASKHAVRVLTEGLRREMRDLKSNIRITSISPGIVRTDIIINAGGTQEDSERFFADNPCLEPVDIAQGLLYALSTPARVQVHEMTIYPVGERY